MVQIASVFIEGGHPSDAITYLEKAIGVEPGSLEAHYLLGEAYYSSNEFAYAQEHWRHVLQMQPDWPGLQAKYDALLGKKTVIAYSRSNEQKPKSETLPVPLSNVTFEGIVAEYENIDAMHGWSSELTSAQSSAIFRDQAERRKELEKSLVGLRVRWYGWVADVREDFYSRGEKRLYKVKVSMYVPQTRTDIFGGASIDGLGNDVFFHVSEEGALRFVQYQAVSFEGTIASVENSYEIAEENGYDIEKHAMLLAGRSKWSTRVGLADVVYWLGN